MVEDERLQMLKSAPVDVLRYLPSGVLKETDRKILGLPNQGKKAWFIRISVQILYLFWFQMKLIYTFYFIKFFSTYQLENCVNA